MTGALAQLYADLHESLLRKDAAPALPHIRTGGRIGPRQQMAIYIEAYRIRLIQAIRSDYPVLLSLLGEPAFDALALRYIDAHPPSHFNLDRYPHGFAAFIAPDLDDPFAADMAALESAIAEVFMAPDSDPLTPEMFRHCTADDFASARLKRRTASRLLAAAYPVDDYLTAWRREEAPARPEKADCFLFLVRHGNEVRRHALGALEYRMLSLLCDNVTIGEALENMERDAPQSLPEIAGALQGWFTRWLENGFFREEKI